MPELTATRPAPPFADAKARLAAAVEAARPEILDLSHRIHADPEPAFEEHQAAGLGRRGPGAPRLRGRGTRPAALATAIRATRRGGRGGDGPRIGILAEYDALPGLGHGCGHNTMAASGVGAAIALAALADELPGEIVFLGHAGRGARQRQADHDRRRPVRRPRRRAALPPVRPVARREPSARVGGRRRRVQRPAGARLVRPVARPERARRDDPAVHLGRAVAPAAPTRRPASTGSSARAARRPTSSRTGPSPGS